MKRNKNTAMEHDSQRSYILSLLSEGINSLAKSKGNVVGLLLVCALLFLGWIFRKPLIGYEDGNLLTTIHLGVFQLTYPIRILFSLCVLFVLFGVKLSDFHINHDIRCTDLENHMGEAPLLKRHYRDAENPQIDIYEFKTSGIPKNEWEKKLTQLEAALNVNVIKMVQKSDKRTILLYAVPAANAFSALLPWSDSFLNKKSFVLTLGEDVAGQRITVDLSKVPHILLGGSTGSGKTVLLKLLLLQSLQKNAMVFLADFKGGVDYSAGWRDKCRFIEQEDDLIQTLSSMVGLLEDRKRTFREMGVCNIDELNKKRSMPSLRIVFAFDEVAQVLDKTGLSKEQKDKILAIESYLATLARQGRAFGIHLILATQRPDANVLTGQIKSNIDCRICGRADDVLSQIILDNTSANDAISKDAQGRFILQDGTIFQAYYFDDGDKNALKG